MNAAIRIPGPLAQEMVEHCRAERPNEACGILAGRDGLVTSVFKMTNALASPVRYRLVPIEQLRVQNEIDERDLEEVAPFHSHTRTEAYPSPTDVKEALGDIPYVIVSLASDPPVIRAFLVVKERWEDPSGEVVEVPVVVDG